MPGRKPALIDLVGALRNQGLIAGVILIPFGLRQTISDGPSTPLVSVASRAVLRGIPLTAPLGAVVVDSSACAAGARMPEQATSTASAPVTRRLTDRRSRGCRRLWFMLLI